MPSIAKREAVAHLIDAAMLADEAGDAVCATVLAGAAEEACSPATQRTFREVFRDAGLHSRRILTGCRTTRRDKRGRKPRRCGSALKTPGFNLPP